MLATPLSRNQVALTQTVASEIQNNYSKTESPGRKCLILDGEL